ncbi:hypothetical protein SAMN02910291_00031 [Desulfovibrio desulfuricans]|uniref:Uncharacterized protein n=2 Tax=Desulfovibrio desulfuricans TaxID=876 RepID=A0AA94HPW9_DESDE|nr:hypothetical protein CNY67_02265 [Desulfovibrio sp. G11]SFW11604.1 hypothetical protein SAMN02910291_00031 [Desulfovibrio desulfuricans]SPD35862.1 Hypothetical protein DSVG11_1765 [Desulfovibrio sp. G11]
MPRDHTVAVAFFNSGPAFPFRPKPYAAGGTLFHASRFTHTGRHIKKRGRSPARKTSRRDLKQKILPRLQEYFLPEMPEQPHEHALWKVQLQPLPRGLVEKTAALFICVIKRRVHVLQILRINIFKANPPQSRSIL